MAKASRLQGGVHSYKPKCSAVKMSFQTPNNSTICIGFIHNAMCAGEELCNVIYSSVTKVTEC